MAPNSIFIEYIGEKVKDFYANKRYSDIGVRITEEVPAADADGQSSRSTVVFSKVIRCHKLVLHINSPYFEEVLEKQGEGVGELEVKVKEGEARYMEMMLSYFYNEDVIKNCNLIDLICLLELAVTYARSHHQKAIVELIEKLEPDFDSSTFGLQKLFLIDKGSLSNLPEELQLSLKLKFSTFLAKYFAPIEENQAKHETFWCLDYSSLWYMLQQDEPIAVSESCLLLLITEWLDYDISRQTPGNIEGLLKSVRLQFLDGMRLHSLGLDHRIFNRWDGYKEWIFHSLEYFLCKRADSTATVCRNIPNGINAWFHSKKNTYETLPAIRWKVHMTTVDKGKRLEPTRHMLIQDGRKFSPKSITITPVQGDDSKFNMSLQITSSYSMIGVRFVVGIVPANKEYGYDFSNKYFHSHFAQKYLKWTDPVKAETNSQDFQLWTIDAELVKISDEYGLYVFLLPLTNAEFNVVSGSYFGPGCSHGSKVLVCRHLCERGGTHHHTCPDAMINLGVSCDFSV